MEPVKPGYVPPVYPVQPMPMPMPTPAPAPMPMPAPVVEKPAHHDIHLHASYQQTSVVFPKPVAAAPVAHHPYSSAGSILVLFILLVIISRGLHKC